MPVNPADSSIVATNEIYSIKKTCFVQIKKGARGGKSLESMETAEQNGDEDREVRVRLFTRQEW